MQSLGSIVARAFAACFVFMWAVVASAQGEKTGGPFVPTPQLVVDAMLDFAKVGPQDFLIDLGSGDGRIVLTAARRYSARGLGIDIDQELIDASNAEAQRLGLAGRVNFQREDVLKARIQDATVLTLYLLPGMMQLLQEKFMRELRPGTRIVSHDFAMGDWKPDREISVNVPEKYGSPGDWKSTIYYWLVPAHVDGRWQLTAPAVSAQPLPITLQQQFQQIESTPPPSSRDSPLRGRVEADRIDFTLTVARAPFHFKGVVTGDTMAGELEHAGRSTRWTAVRVGSGPAATAP